MVQITLSLSIQKKFVREVQIRIRVSESHTLDNL